MSKPQATPTVEAFPEGPWRAVLARDAAQDGAFVYAVRTTGIHCRPSCPSRRPLRENALFFPDAPSAQAAGFRPCLRCSGSAPQGPSAEARACQRAIALIDADPSPQGVSAAALAQAMGLSVSHARRAFKAQLGLTPAAYARLAREARAREALSAERGEATTRAMQDAGFGSAARFYEQAPGALGMSVKAYRSGAPRLRIEFALGACALGEALVARTKMGLCALLLGDDPQSLLLALQARFPHAQLTPASSEFESLAAQAFALCAAPWQGSEFPLDAQGSVFQKRVWQALATIPSGERVSYSELAARIGHPQSARAVANACGANPLAVIIPCHRVTRSDGGLGGYRWGIDRKRALLAFEARASHKPQR